MRISSLIRPTIIRLLSDHPYISLAHELTHVGEKECVENLTLTKDKNIIIYK